MEQMTLPTFLTKVELLLPTDKKVEEMKKITQEDRIWFAKRAKIEHNIEIIAASSKK